MSQRAACFLTLTILVAGDPAQAIVTSDQFGSHVVLPGEPSLGVNTAGVVMVGALPPSGEPLVWCTGCLISDRHALTAAHCFDEDEDGQIDPLLQLFPQSVMFELPDGLLAIEHNVNLIQWPESWPTSYADLAVLMLAEDAPAGVPRYPLYGGSNEVGQEFVRVGYGRPGHGATGQAASDENPPVKRAGLNRFDGVRDDFPGVDFLAYDFDSGLAENNSLALIDVPSDLGFGADEVFPAFGDSGSPSFVGGAVAGIASFVGSLPEADVTDATDSSWGEVGFDVRVAEFQDFIMAATGGAAVFVPEPSALLLVSIAYAVALCARSAHGHKELDSWLEAQNCNPMRKLTLRDTNNSD